MNRGLNRVICVPTALRLVRSPKVEISISQYFFYKKKMFLCPFKRLFKKKNHCDEQHCVKISESLIEF